jgi:hypothetical protein
MTDIIIIIMLEYLKLSVYYYVHFFDYLLLFTTVMIYDYVVYIIITSITLLYEMKVYVHSSYITCGT